jgi:hypothetical protein
MRRIFFCIALLGVLLLLMSAFTIINDDTISGVFKSNHIRTLTVPEGWKISQGGFKGSVIEKKDAGSISIIVNTFQAETELRFMENIIADNLLTFRSSIKGIFEIHRIGIYLVDKKKHMAHVRHVYGAVPAKYQSIAYIGEVGQVVTITMMSDDQDLFQASANDFKTFVESYAVYREEEFAAMNTKKTKDNSTAYRSGSLEINLKPSQKTYY